MLNGPLRGSAIQKCVALLRQRTEGRIQPADAEALRHVLQKLNLFGGKEGNQVFQTRREVMKDDLIPIREAQSASGQ